ncbi:MAG: PKD domain-containing protein [Acidobacteriota bacterium]|nr:PKD domain-containing protein [Acidobacteriota bacterium]MDH3524852.1 PKD domain-containing protein [Acidobacteriota bacterium]
MTAASTPRRTRIPEVAAALLLAAGAGLAAELTDFLPGDAAIGAAAGDQRAPAVAAGDGSVLAVWSDRRSSPTGDPWLEFETAADIWGVRLDAAGEPIEATPFVVTDAPAFQDEPKVAWNGTQWLVVFETKVLSGTGSYYQESLSAVRVSAAGEVLDPRPIRIHNSSTTAWAVASDGADWVVAFEGNGASGDLMAIRIDGAGQAHQPPVALVPATWYLRFSLRLAFAGGVYLLTWDDLDEAQGIRFDPALELLDPAPLSLVPGGIVYGLASKGNQFYAVWHSGSGLRGSRISPAGTLLDPAGVDISGPNNPNSTLSRVAWDGALWRATWGTAAGLRAARIALNGTVLDPGGDLVPGPVAGETSGAPGGGLETIWSPFTGNQYDVLAARLDAVNQPAPNQLLSVGAPMQQRTDVAAGDGGFMTVFRSDSAGTNRIKAMPLGPNGEPLLAEPLELDVGGAVGGPGAPAAAWNGASYLLAWDNASGIVAQRFDPSGTPLDASPFAVVDGFGPVDVAALGTDFLIVGRRFGGSTEFVLPVAARVQGDGTVLDPGGLSLGGYYVRPIRVAALGGRWLAVWQRNFTHDNPLAETLGAFVHPDGTVEPAFTVYGVYSMSGGNSIFDIGLDGGDGAALMVQSAELTSGVETDLVGRLVFADGSLGAVTNFTPWAGNQYRPRVAWDGGQFVVAYNEQRNRFAPHTLDQLDATSDLFGMRVAADGTVLDPLGFAYSLAPASEAYPTVAASGGASLLFGSLLRSAAPLAAYRVGFARRGTGGNDWPVVVATADSAGGDVPLTVQLDSTGSVDPDGTIVSWAWDFGDGASSTEAAPLHTFTEPGRYVVTLTATDDAGEAAVNTVPLPVTAVNQPPVAVAAADPESGPPPLSVTFYAAGSYDPDGEIGNIHWEFSDGGDYWGTPAFHTFTEEGVHSTTLTVWDGRGATGTTTVTVTVGQGNEIFADGFESGDTSAWSATVP